MFRMELAAVKIRPEHVDKLESARDKIRVEIRKSKNQKKLAERRLMFIENFEALNEFIVKELEAIDQRQRPQIDITMLTEKLYENKDYEFCSKIAGRNLVKKLFFLLMNNIPRSCKIKLATLLNDILFYCQSSWNQCSNSAVVDFCQQQISQCDLSNNEQIQYAGQLMKIIRNIASQGIMDFNLYLVDYAFCQKIYDKLHKSPPCGTASRELMKIMSSILLVKVEYKRLETFQNTVMKYLAKSAIGQRSFPVEYIDIVIKLVKRKVQENLLAVVHGELIGYVSEMAVQLNQSEDQVAPFVIRFMKLITLLEEEDYAKILEVMAQFYDCPSKKMFWWALNHENSIVADYSLKGFDAYQLDYIWRYKPSPTEIMEIIGLIFRRFWREKTAYLSLRIINKFIDKDNRVIELMLSQGFLTELSQLTQSLTIPVDVEVVMEVFRLVSGVVKYAQNNGAMSNVKRILVSNGVKEWIESFILHQNQKLSKMAEKIIDGQLRIQKQTLQSES